MDACRGLKGCVLWFSWEIRWGTWPRPQWVYKDVQEVEVGQEGDLES